MADLLRVRDVFKATGRGPVIVAELIDGAVRVGMHLEMPGRPEPLVIAAMEFVDRRALGVGDASLRLHFRNAPALFDVVAAFPEGIEVVAREPA
ncbi:MAG: hypothetical protein ACJ8AO_16855 [Gemmatimonadaceae bacterium]